MDQRPKFKSSYYKTLWKKKRKIFMTLNLAMIFQIWHQKSQATKEKIYKLDFIKIKNFCVLKETIKRVKRQPTEWEKNFANHISNMDLILRLKNTYILPTEENNSIIKWTKDLDRHFSKEDIQMVNKQMKRYSSLIIRETHIKTTLR